MKQLHKIQLGILKRLLFANALNYTKVKPIPEMGNNQFDFHLNTLINKGLIEKKDSKYRLSLKGKEYANRIDTDENKITLQAKLSIWICCVRSKEEEREYLIGTRCKQPFFGKQGFMAGKIKLGEKVVDAAKRELKEEANLVGKPELVMIRHYCVFEKESDKLIEDKFMFLCKVENPSGSLQSNEENTLDWIPEKSIKTKITEPFESIAHLLDILKIIREFKGNVLFQEFSEYTDKF